MRLDVVSTDGPWKDRNPEDIRRAFNAHLEVSAYPEDFLGIVPDLKPSADQKVTFVRKNIEVDAKKRDGLRAPCNTCLTKDKWLHDGILIVDRNGWLYLVGPDCAKMHYGEAVFNAEDRRFSQAEAERLGQEFLVEIEADIPTLLKYALALEKAAISTIEPHERLMKASKAIKAFRDAVHKQDGWLRVDEAFHTTRPNGSSATEHKSRRVSKVRGPAALKGRNDAPVLAAQAVSVLNLYGDSEEQRWEYLAKAELDGKLAELATDLRGAMTALADARVIIEDFQKFFSAENYAGLRAWAENRNCPLVLEVTSHGSSRTIEVSGMRRRFPINVAGLMESLPTVPDCLASQM